MTPELWMVFGLVFVGCIVLIAIAAATDRRDWP